MCTPQMSRKSRLPLETQAPIWLAAFSLAKARVNGILVDAHLVSSISLTKATGDGSVDDAQLANSVSLLKALGDSSLDEIGTSYVF